jgi:hypothetical protein
MTHSHITNRSAEPHTQAQNGKFVAITHGGKDTPSSLPTYLRTLACHPFMNKGELLISLQRNSKRNKVYSFPFAEGKGVSAAARRVISLVQQYPQNVEALPCVYAYVTGRMLALNKTAFTPPILKRFLRGYTSRWSAFRRLGTHFSPQKRNGLETALNAKFDNSKRFKETEEGEIEE